MPDDRSRHRDDDDDLDPRILRELRMLRAEVFAGFGVIARYLRIENQEMRAMTVEMDNLTAAVESNTEVDQSAITLLDGIKAQLDAAIAANDPAALQALSDQLGSSSGDLAAAVTRNTSAAPADPNA